MKLKNMIKSFWILVALLLIVNQVSAAVISGGHGKVFRYYPVGGVKAYFAMDTPMVNPAGCLSAIYYSIPSTHPEYEEYKKIILTALASGKRIGVYVYDDKCDASYPSVYTIYIDG